jgi:2-oxoisovalerate dehydrogenase E2 component (dihydrolipoyl transacylase)
VIINLRTGQSHLHLSALCFSAKLVTVLTCGLQQITKELARLHEMASHNRLSSADIGGGTITLSNIGTIGGKFGSPLLNLPEVAIIALGRIQKLPRFDDDENVYPSSIINV